MKSMGQVLHVPRTSTSNDAGQASNSEEIHKSSLQIISVPETRPDVPAVISEAFRFASPRLSIEVRSSQDMGRLSL